MNNSAIKNVKGSVAVLDIGTNKLACFIAEPDADKNLHITGIGHRLAKGFRAGIIIDAVEAETSIRCAVHAAEEMAGVTVENVIVSLSGTHVHSHLVSVELAISGDAVSERNISDILREGCSLVHESDRSIIHCMGVDYQLDGTRGIKDPINMYGKILGADLHIVSADVSKLNNLSACIGRCHLNAVEFVLSSHTAGLGCLDPDEMELGVTLIDMGAGATSVAVFSGGRNIYASTIPIGGQHVTSDIARGLNISLLDAERIKTLYGSAIVAPHDSEATIDVTQLGDEQELGETYSVTRSALTGIIRPRIEEIIEMVRDKLEASEIGLQAGHSVVLTGGASQLIGIGELTSRLLGKQVRMGKPNLFSGLADSVSGPAFSSTVGMLEYVSNRPMENRLFNTNNDKIGLSAKFNNMIRWLKDNF